MWRDGSPPSLVYVCVCADTLWLNTRDPVDPDVSSFEGMLGQSAYISPKHNAIVVTMGTSAEGQAAWDETREHIVSKWV